MLCLDGRAIRCDVPDIGEAIELGLLTDLVGYTTIAPGVDLWRDLTAQAHGKPLNAAAIGFVDQLYDLTSATLPRIHGNAFIAWHDVCGHPIGIGPEGWLTLCQAFPCISQNFSPELE